MPSHTQVYALFKLPKKSDWAVLPYPPYSMSFLSFYIWPAIMWRNLRVKQAEIYQLQNQFTIKLWRI